MKARIAITLGVTLALVLPATAQAALPKTTNTLIVPGKSLGGVTLGSSPAKVMKAWGNISGCESLCYYAGKRTGEVGEAELETTDEGATYKVKRVFITVSQSPKPNFHTSLTRFKTAPGIGLGSTLKELQKAYGSLKKETTGYYTLSGAKGALTTFVVSPEGKVVSIVIAAGQ